MGWYFRKNIRLGPCRLNISKSGFGFSAGVRGARVSVGPRGTEVHGGVGPFRYRKRISTTSQQPATQSTGLGCIALCLIVGGLLLIATLAAPTGPDTTNQASTPPQVGREQTSGTFRTRLPSPSPSTADAPHGEDEPSAADVTEAVYTGLRDAVVSTVPRAILQQPTIAAGVPTGTSPASATTDAPPDTQLGEFRTWTDSSGQYSTRAALVDYQGEVAYLKKETGQIVAIPLTRLSEPDQEYIKSTVPPVAVIVGKVIGITDGDTLGILDDTKTQHKIRLQGIDAPESGQAYATKARKALANKVFQKDVRIEWREKDRYGRILGQVFLTENGTTRWINRELIEEGWAWHYKKYNTSEVLAQAEHKARGARLGLWQDENPTPPWTYRHTPVVPSSRKPPELPKAEPVEANATPIPSQQEEIVYVTRTGTKYHRAGCRYLRKSSIPMPLSQAAAQYSPCSVCKPPRPRSTTTYQPVVPSYSGGSGVVHVRGYYRKDGTYVRPHTRRRPRR